MPTTLPGIRPTTPSRWVRAARPVTFAFNGGPGSSSVCMMYVQRASLAKLKSDVAALFAQ